MTENKGNKSLIVTLNKLETLIKLCAKNICTNSDINCFADGVTFILKKSSPLTNLLKANIQLDSMARNINKAKHNSDNKRNTPFVHKCKFCGKCYSKKGHLWKHCKENHQGEKVYECDKCGESFDQTSQYFLHKAEHTNSITFKCHQCHKLFSSNANLSRHMVLHTKERPFKCHLCPKTFPYETSLRLHLQRHANITFPCNFCEKSLSSKHRLMRHITNVHNGEKHWKCQECSKEFASLYKLRTHSELLHGKIKKEVKVNPKLFQCNFCNKDFSRQDRFETHLYVHTGEKPFKCEVCNYRFNQKSALTVHKRIHTGEKPFECNFCKRTFRFTGCLQGHMKSHTGEQQKNTIKCKVCGKMFESKYRLKIHTRIHEGDKPFQCAFCPKSFIQNSNLNIHIIRVHTKEKNVKCPCCGKGFYRNKDMELHKKTHTGDRDYSCTRCDKSYITLRSLQRHELEKHEK